MKAHELKEKSRSELLDTLAALEKKLFELRGQKAAAASAQKLNEIKVTRRDIARVKTVLMIQQRTALKAKYEQEKNVPKDIRKFEVKARRQALAPKYAQKKCKSVLRASKFLHPVKFALKA